MECDLPYSLWNCIQLFCEKIDENDYENRYGYEMWGRLVVKKLRQQSSNTV